MSNPIDKISEGLAQRGLGQSADGDLPNWHPEAHKAAANVRRAFTGVYDDAKVNQLAMDAAMAVQAKVDAGEYEGPDLERHPVSEQQRRGHGQEGSTQAAGPGPGEEQQDAGPVDMSARDKIAAGLAARKGGK